MRKKSNFSVFAWVILFSVGLGVGFFIGNVQKERSELVQILPTEYTVQETELPEFDDFKVYDSDILLSDEVIAREKNIDLSKGKKSDEKIITLTEPDGSRTHEQARENLKLNWRVRVSSMSILKITCSKIYGLSLLTLYRK